MNCALPLRPVQLVLDQFVQALQALRDNRLRSLLSVLGIAIGIAAVMAVGTISKGGSYLVFSELETFGLNSLWIYRDLDDQNPQQRVREGPGIDNADYQAIEVHCCPAVRHMSPIVQLQRNAIIKAGDRYSNAELKGVGDVYTQINNDTVVRGRSLRRKDIKSRRAVALIGPTVAADLFGEAVSPIGRDFRIGLRRYTVVGLLKAKSRDFLSSIGSAGGQDANNRILVPFSVLQLHNGNKEINHLHAEAVALELAETAGDEIVALLERRNGRLYTYKSETMASYIETANSILGGVSVVGVVAASVSLLVGGMGIMNIMSTSVLERTREIGLRKAVGADRRHILLQFLTEAALISTLGGFIGLALGGGTSVLLARMTEFPLIPSPSTVLAALLVSILVGILSGYLPARRAARLHPVQALRYE